MIIAVSARQSVIFAKERHPGGLQAGAAIQALLMGTFNSSAHTDTRTWTCESRESMSALNTPDYYG